MNKNDLQFWELMAGKLHGELNPDENMLFGQELEIQQNQRLFSEGKKIRQGLNEAKRLQNSDKAGSWEIIERRVRFGQLKIYSATFLKYAAILIVAFVSGLYVHTILNGHSQDVQYAEIEVMYGQTGHLFLFDGTEVWLNSGTKFKYPDRFNRNERNVFMEGEAYFKVAPDKHLPFIVNTGKLEVEVLGTSFNISAYPTEPNQSVFLDEGKVQINNMAGDKIGEISPGQIAIKTDGNSSIQVQNADSYFYTSWKDGKITFSSEKLGEIAKKMERWYNVEIRFDQETLKDFNFSGTILRNKPIDQTIMAMELLAPIRFIYKVRPNEKNLITIEGKNMKK
jgi:ferric-dicitrate binding protein FerR (iron transport regulator)